MPDVSTEISAQVGARFREEVQRMGGVSRLLEFIEAGKTTVYNWFDSGLIPAATLSACGAAGMDTGYVVTGRRSFPPSGEHLSSEDIAYSLSPQSLRDEVAERGKKYNAHLSVEEAVVLVRSGVYVWVPYYDLPLSAGGGAEVFDEEPKQWNFYTRSYIDSRGLHAADLAEFPVRGYSMPGVIAHGSTALLDRSRKEVGVKDIYAAAVGNELIVKFMERSGDGDVLVTSSDAERYPPMTIRKMDLESGYARIIGRVQSHRVDR